REVFSDLLDGQAAKPCVLVCFHGETQEENAERKRAANAKHRTSLSTERSNHQTIPRTSTATRTPKQTAINRRGPYGCVGSLRRRTPRLRRGTQPARRNGARRPVR